jgi:hypothetical protein
MTRLAMKRVVIAWGLAVPFAAVAQTQRLSLKQGMYVQLTYECVGAPNAAVMFWDGVGFSDARTSKCTSELQSKDGRQYQVSTTCAALADGTPDSTGHVEAFTLTRQSSDRYEMEKTGQHPATYRWCGTQAK